MIFVFDFTTPANTPEDNPVVTPLPLTAGQTYKLDIVFPPGPSHLLHLQISDAIHPVWPSNWGSNFAGDNEVITFHDVYDLSDPPYELTAWTWNESDDKEHRIIIRIGVTPLSTLVNLPIVEVSPAYIESYRLLEEQI